MRKMSEKTKKKRMPFKKLLGKIRLGLTKPEKYTQDGLNKYIEDKGWTQEEFKTATVNHASIQVRKSNPESVWGVSKGYMREVFDGLTIGFSDTVDKYLTAIINNEGISLPSEDDLEFTEQLIDQERADYKEKNAILSTVGFMGGAMFTGAGLTGGALKMLPKLAPSARSTALANLGKDVAVNVPLGVGEASLYAYSKGEDVAEGAEFGATAGGVSSVASRALHPVLSGIGRLGRGIKEAIVPSKKAAREKGLERIVEDWELDGVDPKAKLEELEDLGLGEEVRTGYLGGYNTQQTAKDAVNVRGKAKVEVKGGLLEDMEKNRGLTTGFFKKGLGFDEKGKSLLRGDIIEKMKTDAKPFYKEAYELPPINNPELDRVLKTIDDTTKGEFYESAKTIAKREIELLPEELRSTALLPDEMPYGNVPVAVVDYVKQSVDDLIKSAKGNDRRTLIALRKKMLDITDVETRIKPPTNQLDPQTGRPLPVDTSGLPSKSDSLVAVGESPYAKARSIYSEGHSNLNAYELGGKAYSNKSASEVAFEFGELASEAERDLYRLGASTEAVTKLNRGTAETTNVSKKMLSPEAKEKHSILFSDPDKAQEFTNRLTALSDMHKSATGMLPKSDTGANLMRFAQDMVNFISSGGSLVKRSAVIGGRKLADTVQKRQALAINEEMGKLQNTKGSQKIRGIIDETDELRKKQEREFSQSLINRGLLTGALTNTQAQMLGTGGLLQ